MKSVLLRLEGPMQSWGTQSRFRERDTDAEPSKSGVVGLIAAAMGVRRDDDARVQQLAALPMAIRVDREGTVQRDYHTTGGGRWPGRKAYGVAKSDGDLAGTVLSNRYYLADASFLVAVGCADHALLAEMIEKLADPVFPLSLGRRSFTPAVPVLAAAGPLDGAPELVIRTQPWVGEDRGRPARLRLVLEGTPETGTPRTDVPVSFRSIERRFSRRFVRTDWVAMDELPVEEEKCISLASS